MLKDHLAHLAEADGRSLRRALRNGDGEIEISEILDPLDSFRAVFDRLLAPKRFDDIDFERSTARFVVSTPQGDIDLDDLSSGEKEIAFVFGELQRLRPVNSIILFDEPDLHINEEVQRKIPGELKGLGQDNQIWIATHSLGIMDSVDYSSLFRMNQYDEGNQVQQVFGDSDRYELFRAVTGNAGLVTLAQKIVFLEGIETTDKHIYSSLFSGYRGRISFVPSGSVREVSAVGAKVLELLETSPGFNFYYAIRDRDFMDGQSRQRILDTGRGRIYVLERYHIENYLLDWSAISAVISRNVASPRLERPENVQNALRDSVVEEREQYLAKMVEYAFNSRTRPKYISVGFPDVQIQFARAAERVHSEITQLLSHEGVDSIFSEQERRLDSWLAGGDWVWRLPGRTLLKRINSIEPSIRFEAFKNQLVNEVSERGLPSELSDSIEALVSSS